MSQITIDVNCDLGEGATQGDWQKDALLMPYISSANIACGGHAGTIESINHTISNCKKYDLKIGAHPSFPDKENFGRVAIEISKKELRNAIREQLILFIKICNQQDIHCHHIKPHGALYNLAAQDLKLAILIAEEIAHLSNTVKLMGLADSLMKDAANAVGVDFLNEGFMDRLYHQNGRLVSRENPKAVHSSRETCLEQAYRLTTSQAIDTLEQTKLRLTVDSICLHGDNPHALEIANALNQLLTKNNIAIQ